MMDAAYVKGAKVDRLSVHDGHRVYVATGTVDKSCVESWNMFDDVSWYSEVAV